MKKRYYLSIKTIIVFFIACLIFSCADKKNKHLKLNEIEINRWNASTIHYFKNCCYQRKLPQELSLFYKIINLNCRKVILTQFSKYELDDNVTSFYFYEMLLEEGNYNVTIWFDLDKKERTYSFNYNYFLDSLRYWTRIHSDTYQRVNNRTGVFNEDCCEIYQPSVLSEIYLNDDYEIESIKPVSFMFSY